MSRPGNSQSLKAVIGLLILLCSFAQAQDPWLPSGNDIYNANSGNVGIGISSPGANARLHLYTPSGSGGLWVETAGNNSPLIRFRSASTDRYALTGSSTSFHIWSYERSGGSGNVFTIDKDGQAWIRTSLGIGTTSPSTDLEVNGDIRAGQIYLDDSWGTVAFGVERGTGGYNYSVTGVPPYRFLLDNTNDNFKLQYYDSGTIGNTATGLTTVMTWDNGNVGIGTTSPASKLHINNGELIIQSSVGSGSDATLKFRGGVSVADQWRIAINEDQSNKLYFYDDYNNQFRMVIQQDGNVGIGTTNPQSKLAVNGTITAKEVVVTTTGWPDHVFADTYRLMPLTEVAAYINAHRRLPDVPSAEEVAADGLSLGATQALLLQKIEELTLYVIDLKKENEALKARMDRLVK